METKKILKETGKNLLGVIIGGIVGAIISVFYGWNFWLPAQIENLTLGLGTLIEVIILIVMTIILFSILGAIVGGILGVIFYQVLKRCPNKKKC